MREALRADGVVAARAAAAAAVAAEAAAARAVAELRAAARAAAELRAAVRAAAELRAGADARAAQKKLTAGKEQRGQAGLTRHQAGSCYHLLARGARA